jgi:hypothetical protein
VLTTAPQATTTMMSAEAAMPSPECTQDPTEKCRQSRASLRSRPLLQRQPETAGARQHRQHSRLNRVQARRPPVTLLRRPQAAQVLHREARLRLRVRLHLRVRQRRKAPVRRRALLRQRRQVLRHLRSIDAAEYWLHWRCHLYWLFCDTVRRKAGKHAA